jgi:HIV Tat-specific factor 1
MYASEDGSFNGQALVVFFKEDSVSLAVNLMDDAELRLGDLNTRMRVQKAEFSHKNTGGDGSNGQSSAPRKTVDKKKISRRLGKMQRCVLIHPYSHRHPSDFIHQEIRRLGFRRRVWSFNRTK